MQPVWVYHGRSFPFDFDDYECAVKYKNAVIALSRAKVPDRMTDPAGFIKAYCGAIGAFFDSIFGVGTAEFLFGDNHSKRLCDETYEVFLCFVSAQVRESNKRLAEISEKYAPKGGDIA
ncbi:MAG: DUF6673 family protein [Ruminococcus sp.]